MCVCERERVQITVWHPYAGLRTANSQNLQFKFLLLMNVKLAVKDITAFNLPLQ